MTAIPWILISILILLILGLVFFVWFSRKGKMPPTDYYALFIMGIIWLPFGIAMGNHAFTVLGIVFMITGLVHRKDWKKNRQVWSKLSKEQRKMRIALIAVLGMLVLLGLIFFLLVNYGII